MIAGAKRGLVLLNLLSVHQLVILLRRNATPAAISLITKMSNGENPVKGCSRTERKFNLEYPGSDRAVFEFLLLQLQDPWV